MFVAENHIHETIFGDFSTNGEMRQGLGLASPRA